MSIRTPLTIKVIENDGSKRPWRLVASLWTIEPLVDPAGTGRIANADYRTAGPWI